jgi:ubiquinone/menaquinone biosynthesis C-methylase UbiE
MIMAFTKKKTSEEIISEEKLFWNKESKKMLPKVAKIKKDEFFRKLKKKSMWWHKYISPLQNKLILDVGCGIEDDYISYFTLSKNKVVAIDLSEEIIKINKSISDKVGIKAVITKLHNQFNAAKFFKKKKGLKVMLAVANAEHLPLAKKQFDVAHVKWILHHTQSIPAALKSINRSLKPKGLLICTESNILYPLRWITQTRFLRPINIFRYLAIKYGPLDPNELARTPRTYIRMIKDAGFKIHVVDFKQGFELVGYITRLFIKNKRIINLAKKIDNFLLFLEFPKYFSMDIKILAEKVKDV